MDYGGVQNKREENGVKDTICITDTPIARHDPFGLTSDRNTFFISFGDYRIKTAGAEGVSSVR